MIMYQTLSVFYDMSAFTVVLLSQVNNDTFVCIIDNNLLLYGYLQEANGFGPILSYA